MSDLDLSNQECGEENEQAWNEDPGPVVVNLFIANTSLVRDVQGYQPLTFNLMFKESNFDGIAEETMVMHKKKWTLLGVKLMPKK